MRHKSFLCLLLGCLAAVALTSVANATTYNPATQSHEGACSVETTNVSRAVGDYATNGVLADFAKLIGVHGPGRSLRKAMSKALVVGFVREEVVTANHGCNGEGDWFSVGPRTLYRGEAVGVKVPTKLRSRICARGHRGCKLLTLKASTVFPITCWNPNFGSVSVGVYVHKAKPKRHVKPAKESAPPQAVRPILPPASIAPAPAPTPPAPVLTPPAAAEPAASAAQQQCSAGGGVVVTLSNASTATAPASFVVDEKSYGPIAPGGSEQVTIALAPGASTTITVSSGGSVLIGEESFTNDCHAEPAAAVVAEQCHVAEQGIFPETDIELSNAATATLSASFTIEWTSPSETPESKEYGPLAPGGSEAVAIDHAFGSSELTVRSGGEVILEEELPPICLA